MADKSKTIIVKKVKKGHEGAHGGSWKVAYADFVTAMMAFFLLMWLLAMVSPEKRAALSEYFKEYSIFEQSGKSFMQSSSQIFAKPGGEAKSNPREVAPGTDAQSNEEFSVKLKKAIDEKLQDLKEHLMVDTVEGGVRIQLVDTEGKPMFRPGSSELSPSAKEILRFVVDNIKEMSNKIAVEGHTDSSPLMKQQYTNWELSTERATAARRGLENDGIPTDRIARVVGYADTELLYKNNPTDSRNRRISIILLNDKVAKPKPAAVTAPGVTTTAPVTTTMPTTTVPTISTTVVTTTIPRSAPGQEQKKSLTEPIGVKPKGPIEFNKPFTAPATGK
ncbi:MAG: OmpA family protein [Nitrospirae bacterium]|nr:OmpA family protein [Nitrospirota bacterium]